MYPEPPGAGRLDEGRDGRTEHGGRGNVLGGVEDVERHEDGHDDECLEERVEDCFKK